MKTKWDWSYSSSGLADMSQEALKNYFLYALPPGGFLTRLLSNAPVIDVYRSADHWNKDLIGKYVTWLDEHAPEDAWGSEEAVTSWLAKGPSYQRFQASYTWELLNQTQYDQEPDF